MNAFFLNSAYKYVVVMVMLAEANFFAEKVGLPLEHPITEHDMRSGGHASPPRLMGFGGSLHTDSYAFGFSRGGLANFKTFRFCPDTQSVIREQNLRFAEMKSPIDANQAYELATNWLVAIGVDMLALERKYRPKVSQRRFYPDAKGLTDLGERFFTLPIFDLQWGNIPIASGGKEYPMPALSLTVFGPTKELVEFHLMDRELSRRPEPIKDFEKPLAIPDSEFNALAPTQRSNLISRSVAPEFQRLIFHRGGIVVQPADAAKPTTRKE